MRQKSLQLAFTGKRLYVTIMMETVGRALQALSLKDKLVQSEIAGLPRRFVFCMRVGHGQPSFTIMKEGEHSLRFLTSGSEEDASIKPSLTISIKHIEHAFRMLSFQESTSQAFANDRMIVDGDVSHAVRMVRVLNRLETIILPDFVAGLAVKRVEPLTLKHKLQLATGIYGGAAGSFALDSLRKLAAGSSEHSPLHFISRLLPGKTKTV